jgi:hypothetical protein
MSTTIQTDISDPTLTNINKDLQKLNNDKKIQKNEAEILYNAAKTLQRPEVDNIIDGIYNISKKGVVSTSNSAEVPDDLVLQNPISKIIQSFNNLVDFGKNVSSDADFKKIANGLDVLFGNKPTPANTYKVEVLTEERKELKTTEVQKETVTAETVKIKNSQNERNEVLKNLDIKFTSTAKQEQELNSTNHKFQNLNNQKTLKQIMIFLFKLLWAIILMHVVPNLKKQFFVFVCHLIIILWIQQTYNNYFKIEK